jgi:hypothetical protein
MLQFFYSTCYHPEGYMLADIFYVFQDGYVMHIGKRTGYDSVTVRNQCMQFIEEYEI